MRPASDFLIIQLSNSRIRDTENILLFSRNPLYIKGNDPLRGKHHLVTDDPVSPQNLLSCDQERINAFMNILLIDFFQIKYGIPCKINHMPTILSPF